jgi:hypothetical protein
MSKMTPSRPFSGIGKDPIWPYDHLTLLVTFGMTENYRMKHVVFDIVDINLPFNVVIDRLVLYRFMVATHYRHLMMKIPVPNGVITVRTDHTTAITAVEKLSTLYVAMAVEEGDESLPPTLQTIQAITTRSDAKCQELEKGEGSSQVLAPRPKAKTKGARSGTSRPSSIGPGLRPGPNACPNNSNTVTMKTTQVRVEASQTTHIGVGMRSK